MSRLTDKGYISRAPQTAASIPELPDFDPQLAESPGGQATNAALQRWWDLVRQRIEFNSGDITKRLSSISTSFDNGLTTLSAEITNEQTVRANADTAIASDVTTLTSTVGSLSATVSTAVSTLATAVGYLEGRWTLNVTAGNVTTGMTLFSASGPDTELSYVAFQADRFQINTATGGNKQLFSATATAVKLGDVLTVDLTGQKMFIGTGTYGNANTAFFVDSTGQFSLKDKLTWDGTTLTIVGSLTATTGTIGGWTINSTYLTKDTGTDATSVGMSPADYPFYAGATYANRSTAPFSVTPAGVLKAISATIGTAINYISTELGSLMVTGAMGISGSILYGTGNNYTVFGPGITMGNVLFPYAQITYSTIFGANRHSFEIVDSAVAFGFLHSNELRIQAATGVYSSLASSYLNFSGDTSISRTGVGVLQTNSCFIINGQVSNACALFQGRTDSSNNRNYVMLFTSNPTYYWEISNEDAAGGGTTNGFSLNEYSNAGPFRRFYIEQGGTVNCGVYTAAPLTVVAGTIAWKDAAGNVHNLLCT